MRIKSSETIALIIDYQERLVPVMNEKEQFVRNSAILVEGIKKLGVPIIVSQQYTKGLGNTISEISTVIGEYSPNDKLTFSCVQNEDILHKIQCFDVKNVIVCGCEAHICVLQTVIDLLGIGLNVVLVEDCSASRKKSDLQASIIRARQEGALIATYESILFELCEMAGNDTFKFISKLIK